jgi:hypothetical protein
LFKLLYLKHLDVPSRGDVDWEQSLKDLVHLQAICRHGDVNAKVS